MDLGGGGLVQLAKEAVAVDISRIEASDTVQSHLSATSSSKRLRISPSSVALVQKNVTQYERNDTDQHSKSLDTYFRALYVPVHSTHPGRPQERSWSRDILKCAFLVYCFISCVIATTRVYILYSKAWSSSNRPGDHFQIATETTVSAGTISNYLTRSMAMSSFFEPFIMKNEISTGNVTICAWLDDTEIGYLQEWRKGWHGKNFSTQNNASA